MIVVFTTVFLNYVHEISETVKCKVFSHVILQLSNNIIIFLVCSKKFK